MINDRSLLIVSDDPDHMDHLSEWFAQAGYWAAKQCNTRQAVKAAGSTKFQVAILDLGSAGREGLELFQRLKECRPEMVFVLLSDRDPLSCEGKSEGVCASLETPIAFSELEVCMEDAFELAETQFATPVGV